MKAAVALINEHVVGVNEKCRGLKRCTCPSTNPLELDVASTLEDWFRF